MRANEADDWEKVPGSFLRFRRAGIAVVIIHHANRDGNDMWGTSKREDAAFWAIKVSRNNKGKKMKKVHFLRQDLQKTEMMQGTMDMPSIRHLLRRIIIHG
jgi:hypothetical protein